MRYLESGSSSSCQKADLRSIFEKTMAPCSFALMSSCLGIGRFDDCIALLMFFVSSVILSERTVFEIHGAGSAVV